MLQKMPGGNGHLPDHVRLNQIVYLGSHNCAMAHCYGWKYVQQNCSITDQFYKFGARHFKVPLHWYQEGDTVPQIVLAHEGDGGCNCKVCLVSLLQRLFKAPELASERLLEFARIVHENPREIMILKLESKLTDNTKSNGTAGWNLEQSAEAIDQLLRSLDLDKKAIFFQGNEAPTLGWCRQNGKNLIITVEPKKQIQGELLRYVMHSYTVCAQVNWETDPLKDVTEPKDVAENGRFARGVFCVDNKTIWCPFLEIHYNPENSFRLKCYQTDRPDYQYRKQYNQYDHVKKRYNQFWKLCEKQPNFLAADFIDQGDLLRFVDEMNDPLMQTQQ